MSKDIDKKTISFKYGRITEGSYLIMELPIIKGKVLEKGATFSDYDKTEIDDYGFFKDP